MAQQPPPGQYPPPQGGTPPPGQPPQGFTPPPGQPGQPGAFPPPGTPQKSGGKGKLFGILGAVAVVIVVLVIKFGIGWGLSEASELNADVGDCLDSPADTDDTSTVDCTDPEAVYRVTSVMDSPGTDKDSWCMDDAEATSYLVEGESISKPDTVYCLVEN